MAGFDFRTNISCTCAIFANKYYCQISVITSYSIHYTKLYEFTKQDVENFYIIYHLVKEKGLTLDGAKKKMKENKEDTINNFEVVKSLEEIKAMLLEIKDSL